jgi:hypothetical protein
MIATLLLKPISAFIGIFYVYITYSNLSIHNYATYVAAWACIEISIVLFNFGSITLATRLMSFGKGTPGGPFKLAIAARVTGSLTLILMLSPIIAWQYISPGFVDATLILAGSAALMAESIARTIDSISESWHRPDIAQHSQTFRPALKLAAVMVVVMTQGRLSTPLIMLTEAAAIALSTIWFFCRVTKIKNYDSKIYDEWTSLKYIDKNLIKQHYKAQVLAIFKGVNFITVILAFISTPAATAAFGIIYAVSSIAERYMPTALFQGIIRPWIIQQQDLKKPLKILSFTRKINQVNCLILAIFIGCLPLGKLINSGSDFILYFAQMGFMVAAAQFQSARTILSINLLAQKSGHILFQSEAICASISVLVVLSIYTFGVNGAIAGMFIYEIAWIMTVWYLVNKQNRMLVYIVLKNAIAFLIAVSATLQVISALLPREVGLIGIAVESFLTIFLILIFICLLWRKNYFEDILTYLSIVNTKSLLTYFLKNKN